MSRILPILSFILLLAFNSNGQSARTSPGDGAAKIIKLYPNPATSYVTFDLQGNYKKGLTVQIYNGILGKQMYELSNIPEKLTVTLNGFSRGVYIYHLKNNTGRIIETGKFQVSN